MTAETSSPLELDTAMLDISLSAEAFPPRKQPATQAFLRPSPKHQHAQNALSQ